MLHVRLAITLACINRIWLNIIGNMAIWARRTKCHSPPYPYYYEKIKILLHYIIYMWAVPRDSPLPHGNLEKVGLLFYKYISALLYKYMF